MLSLLVVINFICLVPSTIEGAIVKPQSRRLEAKEGDSMELICKRLSALHKPFVWSRRLEDRADFVVIETTTGAKSKPHLEQQHSKSHHKHRQQNKQKQQEYSQHKVDKNTTQEPIEQQIRHQQQHRKHKTTTATQLSQTEQSNLRRAITMENQRRTEVQKVGNANQENLIHKKSNRTQEKHSKLQKQQHNQEKRQHKTKIDSNKTHDDTQQHSLTKQQQPSKHSGNTTKTTKSFDRNKTSNDHHDGFDVFVTTDANEKLSYLRKEQLNINDSGEYRCMGEGLPSDVVVVSVTRSMDVPVEYNNATIDKKCPEFYKPVCRRIPAISPSLSAPPSLSTPPPLSSSPSLSSSSTSSPTMTSGDGLESPSSSPSSSSSSLSSSSPLSLSSSSPNKKRWKQSIITLTSSYDLSLSTPSSSSLSSLVKWTRFNESSVIQIGETLELRRPTHEDAGVYTCHTSDQSNREDSVLVHYFAPPMVKLQPMKASKFIEGNDLTLKCQIWGWPLPEVTWWKDGTKLETIEITKTKMANNSSSTGSKSSAHEDWKVREYNTSNKTVKFNMTNNKTSGSRDPRMTTWKEEMSNDKNPKNFHAFIAVFEISGLRFNDRAKYSCVASNYIPLPCYNDTRHVFNSTVMIRISGKLDFLWPLLGIIAEFIILFIIIAIYETRKKKKKEDADDDDDEESGSSRAKLHNRRNKTGKNIESNRDQQMPMNRLRKP